MGMSVTSSRQFFSMEWKTPLGSVMAIADQEALYFLEFREGKRIEKGAKALQASTSVPIIKGEIAPLVSIREELEAYFLGTLQTFETPLVLEGSLFQRAVWEALLRVPYGETRSYAEQARSIGKPTAYRAVAGANGANPIAIVVPCHRIVNTDGALGGYGGGVARKQWLLNHEARVRLG